jgi:hypothetical protein
MTTLILQGDDITFDTTGLTLVVGSLALTMEATGAGSSYTDIPYLVLSGTTSVSIGSTYGGASTGESTNELGQLLETNNDLTTVTISGSQTFLFGRPAGHSNPGDGVVTDINATAISPTTIASSLTLINAAATTGELAIFAGATNTGGTGDFENGASLNADITITYNGLKIEGGSGRDSIENDAKHGIVTEGNHADDFVSLGGAAATATLGTGAGDTVLVGISDLGTDEAAGNALGDSVKFGAPATAELIVGSGAEAGSTAGTTSIGETKVHGAAAGMEIGFTSISSSNIVNENAEVAHATSLTAAENEAVHALGGAGVAYFKYGGNEYFVATHATETSVSPSDAVVELVGVVNLIATNASGLVTLHPLV